MALIAFLLASIIGYTILFFGIVIIVVAGRMAFNPYNRENLDFPILISIICIVLGTFLGTYGITNI